MIPIFYPFAKRKETAFLPSFKLFSLFFGNVRKIAYTGARTYTLTITENTFLLFITIFLHYIISFLHWKPTTCAFIPYMKTTFFLYFRTFLHFFFTNILRNQIFVLPLYCQQGERVTDQISWAAYLLKWLATSGLSPYATNVATQ